MSSRDRSERRADQLRLQAAEWVVRINDPDASEADYLAWQRWLEGDAEHNQAYLAAEEAWHLASKAPEPPWPVTIERRARSWGHVALAASLVMAVSISVVFWWSSRNIIETKTAEQRSVRLEDGSQASLAAETRLRIVYDAGQRLLRLERGEAFFQVAHDPARPFVVAIGRERVVAVGTAFNVQANAKRTLVTVTEGSVRLSTEVAVPAGGSNPTNPVSRSATVQTLQIHSGERATADDHGLRRLAIATNPNSAISWRDGRLEYVREPLRFVIEDLNRYTDRKIRLSDPGIAQLEFTGTVFLDHLDEWVATLPGTFPIQLIDHGGERVLTRQSGEPARGTAASQL